MNLDVIDDIRSALDSPSTAHREMLADVAAEYSEAVVATNRRLREVSQLLEQGLAGEALKLAEKKPALLELVAVLDFPELDEWSWLLSTLELETPPRLHLALAEQIDAAYGLMQPLEELLRRHRALAIAKAPLEKRIMILQQLLKRDPGNQGWIEDLEQWQAARLKHIAEQLNSASQNKDLEKLQQFDRELNSSWSISVPAPLIATVQSSLQTIEQEAARRELETIVVKLNDALSAHDEELGRIARDEWFQWLEKANLSPDDELSQLAEESQLWLNDCDQRREQDIAWQSAIYQLEEAIDQNAKLEELNRRIYDVARFERPFPPVLQTRAAEYQSSLIRARKRKSALLYSAVAALLVIAAVTIFYFVQQNNRQRQIASSASELQTMLDNKNYQGAEALYKNFPNSIISDARIASLWTKLSSALVAEQKQYEEYQVAYDQAVASGLDQPNYAEIDRALQLAITEAQKSAVKHFESQVRQRQGELLTSRNETFTLELDKFGEQVRSVIETGASQPSLEQIDLLAKEINVWKNLKKGKNGRYPIVSLELLEKAAPLLTRLEIRKKAVEAELFEQKAFENITQAVSDPFQFSKVLRDFVTSIPDHYLAADFGSVIATHEAGNPFESYYAWSSFLRNNDWSGISTQNGATRLLNQGNELVAKYPNCWLASEFARNKPYLESVASRTNEAGTTHVRELQQRFEGGFWTIAGMVVQKNQSAFYLPRAPQDNTKANQAYYLARDYTEDVRVFSKDHSEYFDLAKHTYVIASLQDQLKSIDKTGWQQTFVNLVREVVDDSTDENYFDPLIKIELLKEILDKGIAGDSCLAEHVGPLSQKIVAINVGQIDYIAARRLPDADRRDYDVARRKASAVVQEIKTEIESCAGKANQALESLGVKVPANILSLRSVGWLYRDKAGEWTILGLPNGIPRQELFCLHSGKETSGVTRLHKVATVDESGVHLVAPNEFLAGRLVLGNVEEPVSVSGK